MSRAWRIEFDGALYHVLARGNARQDIFMDDRDRLLFIDLVGETDPRSCVMIDDLPRTTRAAKDFGLFSIIKGEKGTPEDADARLKDWADLPALLNGRK